jgi:hypothetical protein
MDQGTQPTQGQDGLIQELREGMAGLQQTILALRTEMQQLRSQQAQPVYPPLQQPEVLVAEAIKRPRPKLPGLTEFDGKRHNWEQWYMKAKLKLSVDGESIGSPLDQLAYLYSCLRDDAAKTMHAYCLACFEAKEGTGFNLLEHMNTSYGDPNKKERALQDLHNLEQKDRESFATFLPKFETLLANAGGAEYSNAQRIAYLKQSLNQELREKLVGLSSLLPSEYSAFVSYLQTVSSELTGLRILGKSKEKKMATRTQQADSMDWEPTKITPVTRINTKRASWISQDTYNARMKQRLCLRCGNGDHMVKDCPFLPPLREQSLHANKVKMEDHTRLGSRELVEDDDEPISSLQEKE